MGVLNIPKIPQYKTKLPVSGKEIKYRPITYREEGFLTLVNTDKSVPDNVVRDAIINVIEHCVGNASIQQMSEQDLIWLWIEIRKKSISEVINRRWICQNEFEGGICGEPYDYEMNLNNINLSGDKEFYHEVDIDKDTNYRIFFTHSKIGDEVPEDDSKVEWFYAHLDRIENTVTGDVLKREDIPVAEFDELLAMIPLRDIEVIRLKIQYQLLSITYEDKYKCPKCGMEHTVYERGLRRFF